MTPDRPSRARDYVEWTDRSAAWDHRRWRQTVSGDGPAAEQLHLPHGGVELRWRSGRPPMIAGPTRKLRLETLDPGDEVVGYRFPPGRWPDLPRCSVADLAGRVVPVDDILPTAIEAQPDDPADVRALALFRALDPVLRQRPVRPRVGALLHAVTRGDAPVRALAREAGWSERHARRRIRATAGLAANDLRQLERFQRFVSLVQHDVARSRRRSIADLAVAAGYADQSHLHRACREFAGLTPKRYLDRTHHRCADHRHDAHA